MTNNNHSDSNHNQTNMKKWRAVGILNATVGSVILTIQVATLISLYDWVDWIGIGIWGGCFMISAGSLTLQRSPRLVSMTICAMLSGLALIIFYSWNLGVINTTYYCRNNTSYQNDALCDWRLVSDIIFVVFGVFAVIINLVLTANAPAIMVARSAVRYPVNAYPMTTMTNTTYVMTSRPTTYPVNSQTVYQVPVATYPPQQTTGVIYQTSPGYPPVQPQSGYPQPQAVYYAQTNPPAYTTTAY